jgi:hypothetical protein
MSMKKTSVPLPSCKHCANIGLSSNHFLRDYRTKKVLCPVLNKTICRNCGNSGHTVSHCTKTTTTTTTTTTTAIKPKTKTVTTKKINNKQENIYNVLMDAENYFSTTIKQNSTNNKVVPLPVLPIKTPISGVSYAEMARSAPFIPPTIATIATHAAHTTTLTSRVLWFDEVSSIAD